MCKFPNNFCITMVASYPKHEALAHGRLGCTLNDDHPVAIFIQSDPKVLGESRGIFQIPPGFDIW